MYTEPGIEATACARELLYVYVYIYVYVLLTCVLEPGIEALACACEFRLRLRLVTTTSIIFSSDKIQNGDILVPDHPVCPEKRPLNECYVVI